MLHPNKFTEMLANKLYQGLGERYTVTVANLTDGQSVVVPSVIVLKGGEEEAYYAMPLMQAYIDYANRFKGSFSAYCEDLCKKVEEFDAFTSSQEEVEME